jgi:hypothetical protein
MVDITDPNWKFDGDGVVIGDKSGSMSEAIGGKGAKSKLIRWNVMQESWEAFAKEMCSRDPDGITVAFFNDSFTVTDHVTEDQIAPLFTKHSPGSSTILAPVLAKVIDMFVPAAYEDTPVYEDVTVTKGGFLGIGGTKTTERKLVRTDRKPVKKDPERPVFIAIFTDGAAGDRSEVTKVIVDATQRITDRKHLGILFIQVGHDPNADRFLQQLNSELEPAGAEHDIVAVVQLDDLEDDTPDQMIKRAFTE